MRIMYDGISADAHLIPAAARLVAGYDDGRYAWSASDWARFPNAIHVHIAVFASTNSGTVLDSEPGNATPAQSVDWVLMRRAAGVDPTVYCGRNTWWGQIRAEFQARGVPEPHYWVADYSVDQSNPQIPAGAIALQYTDAGSYDLSVVADYWPGIDPLPDPPKPVELDMDQQMLMLTGMNGTDVWMFVPARGLYWHVADGISVQGYQSVAIKTATISAADHANILAALAKAQAPISLSGQLPLTLSAAGDVTVG